MNIVIPNISDKYLGEYILTKEIDNSFIVEKINADTLYMDADHKYLVERTIFGDDKMVGTASKECGDETFTKTIFIKHNEGTPDLRKCEFIKKITFENILDCIANVDLNIFDYPRLTTNSLNQNTTIERDNFAFDQLNNFGEADYNLETILGIINIPNREYEGFYIEYGRIEVNVESIDLGFGDEYANHRIICNVTYVRIKSSTQISSDWLLIPGDTDYYFSNVRGTVFTLASKTDVWLNNSVDEPFIMKLYRAGQSNFYKNVQISNTVSLSTILEDLMTCTGKILISNFLGINNDGTAPNNKHYTFASDYTQDLRIVQSYDIIKEDAQQDSFGISGKVKSKNLLSNIFKTFNMVLVPDGANIRMEHISYFTNKGIDLTAIEYELSPLSINKDSINTESFRFAQPTPTDGFYEQIIRYETNNIYDEENDEPIQSDLFITDVFGLLNNQFYESSEFEKLFFLLSTNSGSIIGLNNALSMHSIVRELYDIHRPMKTGTIDGNLVTFGGYSVGFEGEIIINSNLINWDNIQPLMSVKTNEGTFLINSLEIDENDQLTLKIKK